MLNRVELLGRIGADPEFFEGKVPVLKFSFATSERWKKDGEPVEKTTWHRCVLFGKKAEGLAPHLSKGELLFLEGKIENGSYEADDGTKRYTSDVHVNNVTFVGTKSSSEDDGAEDAPF